MAGADVTEICVADMHHSVDEQSLYARKLVVLCQHKEPFLAIPSEKFICCIVDVLQLQKAK